MSIPKTKDFIKSSVNCILEWYVIQTWEHTSRGWIVLDTSDSLSLHVCNATEQENSPALRLHVFSHYDQSTM